MVIDGKNTRQRIQLGIVDGEIDGISDVGPDTQKARAFYRFRRDIEPPGFSVGRDALRKSLKKRSRTTPHIDEALPRN